MIKRQASLAKMIDELEAVEFDCDELDEEELDNKYTKVFYKLDALKREQRDVNMKLAYIEGEQIEEKPDFKLQVGPNSSMRLPTSPAARWASVQKILLLVNLLVNLIAVASAAFNPYETLGVSPDASHDQIKKAYRDLARRLHPDKSYLNENEASRKFIELNRAFDILKDPSRRLRYDQYGDLEENRNSRRQHQANRYGQQNRQARGAWPHGGFTFTFTPSPVNSQLRKRSISSRQYYNDYLKESERRPFLLFVYRDFCPSCLMIESTWMKVVDELAKYKVGFFSVNYDHEPKLARDLGVTSVPHIACLIDGQLYPYYGKEISLPLLVQFLKDLLPTNLVPNLLYERDQERFILQGPQQIGRAHV